MAIQIIGKSPQLTLFFDRSTARLSRKQIELLGQTLSEVEGVELVQMRRVWYGCQSITVVFDPSNEPNAILRKMATALREANADVTPGEHTSLLRRPFKRTYRFVSSRSLKSDSSDSDGAMTKEIGPAGCRVIQRRLRELSYAVLTVGCFGMAWVGLVVPGIPTVPFVLMTAHFGLQASPSLRHRLLRSRMFGQMMQDWQEHRAVRRSVQLQAYFFTTLIIVAGFLTSPPVPLFYAVMIAGSALGFYAVSLIPILDQKVQAKDPQTFDMRRTQFDLVAATP